VRLSAARKGVNIECFLLALRIRAFAGDSAPTGRGQSSTQTRSKTAIFDTNQSAVDWSAHLSLDRHPAVAQFVDGRYGSGLVCRSDGLTVGPCEALVLAYSLDVAVADVSELRLLLDETERRRADRFVKEIHQRRFTVAHAALRMALGHVTGRSPRSLKFRTGIYGKPAIDDPQVDIRFNLSHADDRALIAITRGREVGIDIEQERSVEALDLARLCFSGSERSALQQIPESERLHAFFRGWTRKESFVKAIGQGLVYPLDALEVSLDDSRENVLLAYLPVVAESERRWEVRSLCVEPGFAAAITVEGANWRLITRDTSVAELSESVDVRAVRPVTARRATSDRSSLR
jgi:4'-phosphopantetheinyl transferase